MPQTIDQLTIAEILNLEKTGAMCFVEDRELEHIPVSPAGYEPSSSPDHNEEAGSEADQDASTGKSGRKPTVDIGKILALKKAGWKVKDIAGDLGLSESTVSNAIYCEKKKGETACQ